MHQPRSRASCILNIDTIAYETAQPLDSSGGSRRLTFTGNTHADARSSLMKVTPTARVFAQLAGLALAATFGVAHAQSTTVARADVKAETRAANKAGELRVGEVQPDPIPLTSTRSRDERKAETRA